MLYLSIDKNENKLYSFFIVIFIVFNRLIKKYNKIITIEESFKDYGALENILRIEIMKTKNHISLQSFAFKNKYTFKIGDRNFIHSLHNMSAKDLLREIKI